MDYKMYISFLAIILTLLSYIPYYRDIFLGKTKPHLFSWLIWTIVVLITLFLQISYGGGVGSYVTLALLCMFSPIFILSFKYGTKDIRKVDYLFLFLAFVSLILWLVFDLPKFSALLLVLVDFFAFIPTIRKSWIDPFSETISLYSITTFRQILALFALENLNIITASFSLFWIIANGLFAIMLLYRRNKLK